VTLHMSDNRDCISLAGGFTAAKKSRGTCSGKIDSNQEPRDRRDKRPTLIRERQVGLRTATSSRPLLLLNISTMGRDCGWLPEGKTTKGADHPCLYYLLCYTRWGGGAAGRGDARFSCTGGAREILPFPFPLLLRPECIIAHYSYDKI
jgi:hypothetical protein